MQPHNGLPERLSALLAPMVPPRSSILVGLSGGIDSVVLLDVLTRLAPRYSWRLSAMHVHHGISPNADAWRNFCGALCASYSVPLHIEHVDINPLREHGVEAAARKLRHEAFLKQACDFIALAHHADDQAETLLLQILRGSGVRGASAMPVLNSQKHAQEVSPMLLRPLLHSTRQEIADYAAAYGLHWIEDESNADDSYPRNFLRHRVLPVLERRFPSYRDTLARSALHFAEAGELLGDLARMDCSGAIHAGALSVCALKALSPPRAKNLLRYFLDSCGAPMPQAVQLDDILHQLCQARRDAVVRVAYGAWEVRRYQGKAYVLRAPGRFDRSLVLSWRDEAELEWPALNTRLRFERLRGDGISLEKLRRTPVTLRLRRGGESLRPHPNAAMRTLKNLLQEHHVPPWQRERLPLLYCGEELACIPGVAIAAEYQAEAGEAGLGVLVE